MGCRYGEGNDTGYQLGDHYKGAMMTAWARRVAVVSGRRRWIRDIVGP